MNSRIHHSLSRGADWIIAALVTVVLTSGGAADARRLALVIGNDRLRAAGLPT
jgi:hypothetical protein